MSADLVAFLRARLAEEQAEAEKLADTDDWWMPDSWVIRWEETGTYDSYAYLRIAKKRVLAEVAAKRQIIDLYEIADTSFELDRDAWHVMRNVVRQLATPYADHPDYDEGWRP